MALACIIGRKLSIVCLPAGRSKFTNENVERSPAKKKKGKKNEELKPNPPIHSIAAERRELELYSSTTPEPSELGSAMGGTVYPPSLWAEKTKQILLLLFQKTIVFNLVHPPDFLSFRRHCTEHYSKCEQGIKVAFFPISRRKSYPPDVMTQVLTT